MSQLLNDGNASAALQWMKELQKENPQTLFRGQKVIYPTIFPSIARTEKIKQRAILKLCVHTRSFGSGITGYRLKDELMDLALIQHYLEVSPMLDLTGTPEVALFFALLDHDASKQQIVYAFNQEALKEAGAKVVNHDFLLFPLDEGGHRCRWIRQDGFGICASTWKDLEITSNFDLLKFPHQKFVFQPSKFEDRIVDEWGDLLTIQDDPVGIRAINFLYSLSEHLEISSLLSGELDKHHVKPFKLVLADKLNDLIKIAQKNHFDEENAELLKMVEANEKKYWDTSWDAGLEFIEKKLKEKLKQV